MRLLMILLSSTSSTCAYVAGCIKNRVCRTAAVTFRRALAALACAALMPGRIDAVECIDYRNYVRWLGGTSQNDVRDLVLSGSIAFTSSDDGTVESVLIADPHSPQLVGALDLQSALGNLCLSDDDQLAVVCIGSGIAVIDVSNPADLQLLGTASMPDVANSVVMSDRYAFVATGFSGIQVVDLKDPAAPSMVANLNTPGEAMGQAVEGDLLYQCDGPSGLRVINIQNPLQPIIIGSMNTPGCAISVAVANDRAYIADCEHGLRIADVSNPSAPLPLGVASTRGIAAAVSLDGALAYVADGQGVSIVAVADPFNPIIVGELSTPDAGYQVVVADHRLYLTRGVDIYDVTSPVLPLELASLDTFGEIRDLVVDGEHAFLAEDFPGSTMKVVSLSTPDSPSVVASVPLQVGASAIALQGDIAFVAGGSRLTVVDVSNPLSPVIMDSESLSQGGALDVVVTDSYCYVSGLFGINVIDVEDPNAIIPVGSVHLGYRLHQIAIQGSKMLGASDYGLHVIDLTYPEFPEAIVLVSLPNAGAVACQDNVAIVGGFRWLASVDIANPEIPQVIQEIALPSHVNSIVRHGRYAYLASGFTGMCIVDVLNAQSMTFIGGGSSQEYAWAIGVANEYSVIADSFSGIQVSANQCSPATAVGDEIVPPGQMRIAVFPNPARGQVRFHLVGSGPLRGIDVFDSQGRTVDQLMNQDGHWMWTPGASVPAGVYFARPEAATGAAPAVKFLYLR